MHAHAFVCPGAIQRHNRNAQHALQDTFALFLHVNLVYCPRNCFIHDTYNRFIARQGTSKS